MELLDAKHRSFLTCVLVALSGCSSAMPNSSTSIALFPSHVSENRGQPVSGRNGHRTKGTDLLYIADSTGYVYTFTYPNGTPVASFGADASGGICSDQSGDVFVTDFGGEKVFEYAHGGSSPIATLLPNAEPRACSVDPITGDLATVNTDYGSTTNVSIFKNASGSPTKYADPGAEFGQTCSYDDQGNLYISAYNSGAPFFIAELPHGTSNFTNITVAGDFRGNNFLSWDGKYVAVTNAKQGKAVIVSRIQVSGSSGTVVGTTKLQGSVGYRKYFFIQGNKIITPKSGKGFGARKIGIWKYPSGGAATNVIKVPKNTEFGPGIALGITISPASP